MIVTMTGANDLLRTDALRTSIERFRRQNGDMAIEHIDAEDADFNQLAASIQSLPFLVPRKLVILLSPSQQKQFVEQLETLLSNVDESVDLIIHEPKLDKRSQYYKTLKEKTDYQEYAQLDGRSLIDWMVRYVKDQQGSLNSSVAQYMVDRLGTNQQQLKNQLDVVLLYNPDITKQTVDLLTEAVPQSTIFQLLDAALAGNQEQMLRLYREQRLLKVEPQQIIALLTWQLHILALVKTAASQNAGEIVKQAQLSPFVVRKAMQLTRGLSLERLRTIIGQALDLDVRLKREMINADEALQYYLLGLAGD